MKAIACEIPAERGEPLSRFFVPDIQRLLLEEGEVESISASTIWRILEEDALKPWRHRSWIWSRDPHFAKRAGEVLDLYQGLWKGRTLGDDELVLSADEKTQIQALRRLSPPQVHADGRGQRVEHEYERLGTWAYLAAWDVHRGKILGRMEEGNGKEPFRRLVRQRMAEEPYRSARRVFWIVDQGGAHHPSTFPGWLRENFPRARAVYTPVHASWLNQIEIYFSILQRKALTPADFLTLPEAPDQILRFERLWGKTARPFRWKFTRKDLRDLLKRLPDRVLGHEVGAGHLSVRSRAAG